MRVPDGCDRFVATPGRQPGMIIGVTLWRLIPVLGGLALVAASSTLIAGRPHRSPEGGARSRGRLFSSRRLGGVVCADGIGVSATLAELLRGVRAAGRIEQLDSGLALEQRQQMAQTVDHRILEAVAAGAAGATADQVAEALHVGLSRAQERVRRARRDAQPAPQVEAPDVWLPTPRCRRPAPPCGRYLAGAATTAATTWGRG